MLASTVLFSGYVLNAPRAGLAPIRASAGRMSAAEDAAKAAWLAKQDTPAYGKAAAASAAGAAVSPGPMSSAGEEAAKNAWLAKLDAPAWGKAAAAVAAASATASTAAFGDNNAAKAAWLAKLDAPTWGAVAAAVSEVAAGVGPAGGDNDAAKAAWLAKLDAPTWGKASAALINIAGQAGASAAQEADCDRGVEVACDGMSREEEAKRAYLAKLDAPTWGAVTAAVAAVASAVSGGGGGAVSAEEVAKQKWLAAQDALFR